MAASVPEGSFPWTLAVYQAMAGRVAAIWAASSGVVTLGSVSRFCSAAIPSAFATFAGWPTNEYGICVPLTDVPKVSVVTRLLCESTMSKYRLVSTVVARRSGHPGMATVGAVTAGSYVGVDG